VDDLGALARADPQARPLAEPAPPVANPASSTLFSLLAAMRPRQWTKNVLVFVAPAAAGVLGHRVDAVRTLVAFGVFCLAASGTYLFNDALDAESDQRHPDKRHRPIASGAVPRRTAAASGLALLVVATAAAWTGTGWELALVVGTYALVSVAYTVRLKREHVVELAAVASGFLLRAIAGGAATHVPLSNWFLVVTSFGALFVVTGKRAAEYSRLGNRRADHRPVLADYTHSFLRSTLTMTASVTVTAYCLWAFERTGFHARAGQHVWIELTAVPVVLGVLHILHLLHAGRGEAPEELVFEDRFMQVLGLAWLGLFTIGLYG
jgi:decaprenyl-phosphate phosphoribosyltransferase